MARDVLSIYYNCTQRSCVSEPSAEILLLRDSKIDTLRVSGPAGLLPYEVDSAERAEQTIIRILPPSGALSYSYLVNNLRWRPRYQLLVDEHSDPSMEQMGELRGFLTLEAVINVPANTLIAATRVDLVAGDMFSLPDNDEVARPLYAQSLRAMAAPGLAEPTEVEGSAFEDYVRYQLGAMSLSRLKVVQLSSLPIKLEKIYVSHLQRDTAWGYRMIAPDYLPRGTCYVYSKNAPEPLGGVLGAGLIREVRHSGPIELLLGNSSNLRVVGSIAKSREDRESKKERWLLQATITNYDAQIALLIIRLDIADATILASSCKWLRKFGNIELELRVAANRSDTFSCTLDLQNN